MAGTYMDVPLAIRFDDGTEVRCVARPRDLMAWQRNARGKVSLADVLPVNDAGTGLDIGKFNLPELWRLAWMVARREGHFDGTVEQFGELVDVSVMDADDDDGDVGPTGAANSAASSQSLPSKPESPRRSGPKKAPGSS